MPHAVTLPLAIFLGLAYAFARGYDGGQSFLVCCAAWLILQTVYYAGTACLPGRNRRHR